jgi:hypothetical protein
MYLLLMNIGSTALRRTFRIEFVLTLAVKATNRGILLVEHYTIILATANSIYKGTVGDRLTYEG